MVLGNAIGVISAVNECVVFFQWAKSAISSLHSRWSGPQEQRVQDDILHLQSGLQHLRDSLPRMKYLIDGAEWMSHKNCVAESLSNLKDAVYNADDLLDEFRWYEMKVELEGKASKSPFDDFYRTVIQGSFSKLDDVQKRLDRLSSELKLLGVCEVTPRFDKSVWTETTSLPKKEKDLFGRDNEVKLLMKSLGVPTDSKRKRPTRTDIASTSTSQSNQVSNESKIQSLPVLPIVGMGGLGKTTLAQHICSNTKVKKHFEVIIWICVSDDFEVKRLTKEAIQSCPGNKETYDNLSSLQHALSNRLKNKRFLIVLDDMWDDALKENGKRWETFYEPLKQSAQEGSMMLITTRCRKVAEGVGTMKPVTLKGLKGDVFFDFFKLCIFDSETSINDPKLEPIAKSIQFKLKGSPLAAKTLGRILKMDLQASHWNSILESDLWQLTQEPTDILPALRLSFMYLPFRLKQCFSFCAVYPKDYKFEKEHLAEIWVAEGFVEPQGNDSLKKLGCQYFEDLVTRSFFQKVTGGRYVIHDLLHDMAQKVSEDDCFILRNKNDFDKVGTSTNVRHIYIHPNKDIVNSDLLRLCKHTNLRTIICEQQLGNRTSSVMDKWCSNLLCLRVISLVATNELPDSIGNLKHLRYLKISADCPLSIPLTFCQLYNLQILNVQRCNIESLPNDFGNLKSLHRFMSRTFSYYPGIYMVFDVVSKEIQGFGLIKNLNQFRGSLRIGNVRMLSKDHAAEAELSKKHLSDLILNWSDRYCLSANPQESENMQPAVEVLQLLQPPMSLTTLGIIGYPGVPLPTWFQAQNIPSLTSLTLEKCHELVSISCSMVVSQSINLNEIPAVLDDSNSRIFMSLTEVNIEQCQKLLSLEHFLHPDYVPAIKKIRLINCESLVSVLIERFGDLCLLEELVVRDCPNILSQTLVSQSLKQLELGDCGNLFDNIDCCSLTNFTISSYSASIGVSTTLRVCVGNGSERAFSKLNSLNIWNCPELSIIEFYGLLTEEYPPTIEIINILECSKLMSLPAGWFGSFTSLKHLWVSECPLLNWQRGLVLPSSLQTLELNNCGDFSASVPGCLENLTSLVSLKIYGCEGLTSIPGSIWRSDLALLEKLKLWRCPNLVSIGGAKAVARIKEVLILECPKFEEGENIRYQRSSRRN